MLNRPTHEVEVVLYGTTGELQLQSRVQPTQQACRNAVAAEAFAVADAETDNPLNNEMGEDQYLNITIEQELKFPDTESLAALLSLKQVCDQLCDWHSACHLCCSHSNTVELSQSSLQGNQAGQLV